MDEKTLVEQLSAKPVEVGRIESQVNTMWQEAAEGLGMLPPVTRACTLTLVAYVENADDAASANDTFSLIMGRHPGRLVLVVANRGADAPKVDAYVSAVCQVPPPNGNQVCCEEITLLADGRAVDELQSTIFSILAPDVPAVLWWRAQPDWSNALLQSLEDTVDRVILDCARTTDPFAVWRGMDQVLGETAFGDLSWTRLNPWRELIAQFFDPPEVNPLLGHIDGVHLHYSSSGERRNPAQAFLLTGWLATRLGWQSRRIHQMGPGEYEWELTQDDRPVRVHIHPREAEDPRTGRLLVCELHAADERGPAEFIVTRRLEEDYIQTEMRLFDRGPVACASFLEMRREHDLLAAQLDHAGRDEVFESTMRLLAAASRALAEGGDEYC